FFFRNRFGILADENIILSRSGSFFDFFRTTVTALLDDDPIDVSTGHTKISFLRAAIPYNETLVAFSDQTQFRFGGNDTLTPKTANLTPIAEYSCSALCRPIAVGQSIFFVQDVDRAGSYATVWE